MHSGDKMALSLRGYPDILMPGEVRGNNKTKGIGDLFSTEQVDLATILSRLVGKTNFPLSLSRVPTQPSRLVSNFLKLKTLQLCTL